MTPERHQQVEQLFASARKLPEHQRASFLAEACGGNQTLQQEVESLLACDTENGSFLERPVVGHWTEVDALNRPVYAPGQEIDHYRIRSLLGKGGMGEVYRARDTRLNRDVALKVLPAEYSTDQARLRRLEQEAQTAGRLNHPNLLTIYDIGVNGGAPYIVTELLEGEELRGALKAGPIPEEKVVEYARQIAAGLAAAHAKGIVHRDLKPENIFIMKDGRLKILDFGLAKWSADNVTATIKAPLPQLTTPGMIVGTLAYMSPEQLRGNEVDHRADIFALGVMMYEMRSGKAPFSFEAGLGIISEILNNDPPDLASVSENTSPVLSRIVRRCLQKKSRAAFSICE